MKNTKTQIIAFALVFTFFTATLIMINQSLHSSLSSAKKAAAAAPEERR